MIFFQLLFGRLLIPYRHIQYPQSRRQTLFFQLFSHLLLELYLYDFPRSILSLVGKIFFFSFIYIGGRRAGLEKWCHLAQLTILPQGNFFFMAEFLSRFILFSLLFILQHLSHMGGFWFLVGCAGVRVYSRDQVDVCIYIPPPLRPLKERASELVGGGTL